VEDKIKSIIRDSASATEKLAENAGEIAEAVEMMAQAIEGGRKILLFGNGGSAADSQHIAAELIGRFKITRPALCAIALTTNTSSITAISNDFGYDEVFARQIEGLGKEGDVAIGISTSGKSKNVIEAVVKAKAKALKVITLTGRDPGPLGELADISIAVPAGDTPRIQELHILTGHIICELLDERLFG